MINTAQGEDLAYQGGYKDGTADGYNDALADVHAMFASWEGEGDGTWRQIHLGEVLKAIEAMIKESE